MKTSLYFIALGAICLALPTGCTKDVKTDSAAPKIQKTEDWPEPAPVTEIKSAAEKTGYAMGVDNGQNIIKQFQGMDIDLKALAYGFTDELRALPKKFSDPEIIQNIEAMRKKMTDKAPITVDRQKAGYAVGVDHAYSLKQQFKPEDSDWRAMAQGFSDEINGRPKKITDEEIAKSIETIRKKMIDQMMADGMKAKADKKAPEGARNLEEGEKFLEENAKKEGVKTTASGLQYIVLKDGDGAQPSASDTVTVHYQGSLLNGKIFDSSYIRKEPIAFGLSEVIKGWTEGVQLMKIGSKYKFFIPSDLAYGEYGAPPNIGPNCTLIFEVELLKIGS